MEFKNDWAMYRATNSSANVFEYEKKPSLAADFFLAEGGKYQMITLEGDATNWQNSLVCRYTDLQMDLYNKDEGWNLLHKGRQVMYEQDYFLELVYDDGSKIVSKTGGVNRNGDDDVVAFRKYNATGFKDGLAFSDDMIPPETPISRCVDVKITPKSELHKPMVYGKIPPVGWKGEGLPPVGLRIEVKDTNYTWTKGEVKYKSDENIVVDTHYGEVNYMAPFNGLKFRPIRTEKQIFVDESKKHCAYPGSFNSTFKHFAEALYDAGMRMPGETNETTN